MKITNKEDIKGIQGNFKLIIIMCFESKFEILLIVIFNLIFFFYIYSLYITTLYYSVFMETETHSFPINQVLLA